MWRENKTMIQAHNDPTVWQIFLFSNITSIKFFHWKFLPGQLCKNTFRLVMYISIRKKLMGWMIQTSVISLQKEEQTLLLQNKKCLLPSGSTLFSSLCAKKTQSIAKDNRALYIHYRWAEALISSSENKFSMLLELFLGCTFIIGLFIGIYLMQSQIKSNQFTYFCN